MTNTEKVSKQAKRALDEAKKRRAEKVTNFKNHRQASWNFRAHTKQIGNNKDW